MQSKIFPDRVVSYNSVHLWLSKKYSKTGTCSMCKNSRDTRWTKKKAGPYDFDVKLFEEECVSCIQKRRTRKPRIVYSQSWNFVEKKWDVAATVIQNGKNIRKSIPV